MNYKVSIIMGIYNCEKYLSESIESLLCQTYKDWELIMCDDGSVDNTVKVAYEHVSKYPEKIKLLINEKNMGLNYTLNKCLSNANGEYIARQDGDDTSVFDRLEKEVIFLDNNPEYALVSCNMNFFDETGIWGRSNFVEIPSKKDFIKGSPFCHAGCMIRKNVLTEVEGYTINEKLLRVEDYHLWFKIYEKGYKGYSIQECLYSMRDDKNAFKRRNWKNRINEVHVKLLGYKMLGIKKRYYIFAYRSIIVGLLPEKLYKFLHKKVGEKNAKKGN